MKSKNSNRLVYLQGLRLGEAKAVNAQRDARVSRFAENAKKQIRAALAKEQSREAPRIYGSFRPTDEVSMTFSALIAGPVKKHVTY